jgi:hypothetical protein
MGLRLVDMSANFWIEGRISGKCRTDYAIIRMVEYFEEEFGAGLGKRHIAEFVDDKQFDDGELGLELAQTPLVARFHQLMNEPGRREEGNGEAMLAGGEAKRQTRIHLARAGITQRRRPSSSIFGEARKSWRADRVRPRCRRRAVRQSSVHGGQRIDSGGRDSAPRAWRSTP